LILYFPPVIANPVAYYERERSKTGPTQNDRDRRLVQWAKLVYSFYKIIGEK